MSAQRGVVDEELVIRQCQAGESEAFRVLVEKYGRVLYGTAYLMTRDRSLSEDLVQEAFLLAWRGIRSFKAGTNFKAWLVRILVHRVIDERRKKRPALAGDGGSAVETLADSSHMEDAVLAEDDRRLVAAALGTLPEDLRETVVLRFYADLTVPEIAAAMGTAEGTVKSRLHRAMERLREHFRQGEGAGPGVENREDMR